MAGIDGYTNIVALSEKAFDQNHANVEHHLAALKAVANTLLLQENARQTFADSGYAVKTADRLRVNGNDCQEEIIYSRILFLLTYQTRFDFDLLFDNYHLIESIHANLDAHASRFSRHDLPDEHSNSLRVRALSETLKLVFNLNQFYPQRAQSFQILLNPILTILAHLRLASNPLDTPVNYLINALLNTELEQRDDTAKLNADQSHDPLFPEAAPNGHVERLIEILDRAVQQYSEEELEASIVPLLTLIRRIKELAPQSTVKRMSDMLLPSNSERDQPLGTSDNLASRLLKLSTTPVAPQVREGISSLLFELSDKDPAMFVRNVGYGYAAGYLLTHKIPIPEASLQDDVGAKVTNVDGCEINPITGQRRDMEPPDPTLGMTDEEKEREAERLFVLFERLKATGVMDVTNPVELAARKGEFEDVEDSDHE